MLDHLEKKLFITDLLGVQSLKRRQGFVRVKKFHSLNKSNYLMSIGGILLLISSLSQTALQT